MPARCGYLAGCPASGILVWYLDSLLKGQISQVEKGGINSQYACVACNYSNFEHFKTKLTILTTDSELPPSDKTSSSSTHLLFYSTADLLQVIASHFQGNPHRSLDG
ncbi:hypothetical protein ACMFMG_008559 [Clarireedia jacksonii]